MHKIAKEAISTKKKVFQSKFREPIDFCKANSSHVIQFDP